MIGLALIALGTGGIKPCVAAFGGDQFKLPNQERQLQVNEEANSKLKFTLDSVLDSWPMPQVIVTYEKQTYIF